MLKRNLLAPLVLASLCAPYESDPAPGGEAPPPTPTPKPTKAKKAKTAVKKSAAKAEKKAAKKKSTKAKGEGTKGPGALEDYAPKYNKDNEKKTAGGNTSVDSNDDVAKKLRGKPLDEVYTFAAKTINDPEFDVKALKKKYGHLNVGMQRMNLGNKIRGILNAK